MKCSWCNTSFGVCYRRGRASVVQSSMSLSCADRYRGLGHTLDSGSWVADRAVGVVRHRCMEWDDKIDVVEEQTFPLLVCPCATRLRRGACSDRSTGLFEAARWLSWTLRRLQLCVCNAPCCPRLRVASYWDARGVAALFAGSTETWIACAQATARRRETARTRGSSAVDAVLSLASRWSCGDGRIDRHERTGSRQ